MATPADKQMIFKSNGVDCSVHDVENKVFLLLLETEGVSVRLCVCFMALFSCWLASKLTLIGVIVINIW